MISTMPEAMTVTRNQDISFEITNQKGPTMYDKSRSPWNHI